MATTSYAKFGVIVAFQISSLVFFNGRLYLSENHVTRIPAPDFSMPFNILTFTCLTIGYYFLQVLRLTIDKYEIDKEEKGSIAQRVFRKVFNLVFGSGDNNKVKVD